MKYSLILILFTFSIFSEDIKKNPSIEQSVFTIKEGKVFRNDELIPKANASSFRVLNALCHGDEDKHCFGADNSRVFYYSNELPNSDPKTFQFLGNGYSADKSNVYYIMDNVFKKVKGIDRKTFVVLGIPDWANSAYAYAKDKKYAYYDGQKIPGSHGQSFTLINKEGKYHAKDKFRFYTYSQGILITKKNSKK